VSIYLPGVAWVELDPTNGIIGNRCVVSAKVPCDHRNVRPRHGTWTGLPSDSLGVIVEVDVIADD
jgi:transglutaminase-like putative cysteine protease